MSLDLFAPLARSEFLPLQSRFVMSAMTRGFANQGHEATDAIAAYYTRRAAAGAGLILTEGVIIHHSGDGYNNVPHIETAAQAESWRPVIAGVHANGGKIACQLWHCGRISHSDYTGGVAPVSSTKQAASGMNRQNGKPFGEPRALSMDEMPTIYGYFADAAERALAVGFDAVQLHLGHGYLADQFFDARVNDRADAYGGSIENRCRFGLELLESVLNRVEARRTIVRISPSRFMGGLYDWPDLEAMVEFLLPRMWDMGLRTLDISCANANYFDTSGRVIRMARPLWPGVLMGGASLSVADAEAELKSGLLDAVTWGRAFLANPDLPHRIKRGEDLRAFDPSMLATLD
jgi:N-ethylmaleimide reductase